MTETNDRIHEDLRYVRDVVGEAQRSESPAAIYFLWAALSIVGFALIDFRPAAAGPYWAVAGPLGGVLSGWLGYRQGQRMGQQSAREGTYHALHWIGMMVAIFLTIPLRTHMGVPDRALPTIILLVIALAYYTAGIYLDRKMLWVGLLAAACYIATIVVGPWPWLWTTCGAVVALGLSVNGVTSLAARRTGKARPGRP